MASQSHYPGRLPQWVWGGVGHLYFLKVYEWFLFTARFRGFRWLPAHLLLHYIDSTLMLGIVHYVPLSPLLCPPQTTYLINLCSWHLFMCVGEKNGLIGSSRYCRYRYMLVEGCRAVILTPQLHENYLESLLKMKIPNESVFRDGSLNL